MVCSINLTSQSGTRRRAHGITLTKCKAGVLGAAGAVVGLLDVAFSVMHAIRKAKDAIQGTSKNF